MEIQPTSKLIFYASGFNSLRVRMYLKEKGFPYEEKEVNLLAGEHKKPDYLKINPRGEVPAITDGETHVAESVGIIEYLESTYSGSGPLIPSSKLNRATCYERIAQFHQKLDGKNVFVQVLFQKNTKEELKDAISALTNEIKNWDTYLEGRQYLAQSFSIADIIILPNMIMVKLLGFNFAPHKNLSDWLDRMLARESVKNDSILTGWTQVAQNLGFKEGVPQIF